MEVPCIKAQQSLSRRRIRHVELIRSYGVALGANAKQLSFNGHLVMLSVDSGENLIERVQQTPAGRQSIGRNVLVAIWNPDVHHCRRFQLAAHIVTDLAASDAMIDPERAD